MNYELKTIQPGSVFFNAIRIFIIVGFLVAILSFFVVQNPNFALQIWWQKILATLLFTIVYAVVVSAVLSLIAFLYNLWTQSFPGIKFHFEQTEE
jgi:hypothetical protein